MIKLFTNISAKLSADLLKVLNANNAPVENKHLQNISNNANVMLISSGETCELVGDLKCIIDAHTSLSLFLKENYNIASDVLHSDVKPKVKHSEVSESSSNSSLQVDQPKCDNSGLSNIQTETDQRKTNSSGIPDPIVFSFRLNDFTNNYESELSLNSTGDPQKSQEIDSTQASEESIPNKSEVADEQVTSNLYTEIKDTKVELNRFLRGKSERKTNSVKRLKQQPQVTSKRKDNLTGRDKNKRKKKRRVTLKTLGTKSKETQSKASNKKNVEHDAVDEEHYNEEDDETDTYNDDEEWDMFLQSDHDESDSEYIPDESENAFEMDKPVNKKHTKKGLKENSSRRSSKSKQNSRTKNRNVLEKKIKNNDATNDWVCEKCDENFESKSEWEKHIKSHLPKNFEERIGIDPIDPKAKDIPCPEVNCKYVAREKKHLIEHFLRVHGEKNLQCSHCEAKFSIRRDLMRHQRIHGDPKHCCQQCGKFYRCKRAYLEHQKSHEDNYIKPEFTCETCGKSFSTKYVLQYHIKSEHLGIKRSYLCPTCGKSFTQKNSYVMHANVHLGIRPYVCEICGNSFPYEKSLKEHKYMHDEVKRFKCDTCGKFFRQPSALATHMKIHKSTKEHLCGTCGKGFTQKQALSRHERIHTGDKPFICTVCGRNFSDASIIRRHMIMVHKKDPKEWRSEVQSEVPRQTDFFIEVLEGDKQPQLKRKGRPPRGTDDISMLQATGEKDQQRIKKKESDQSKVDNSQKIKIPQNVDQSSESRAIAALTLSSMASGLQAEGTSQVQNKDSSQTVSNPGEVFRSVNMSLTGQVYPVGCYTSLQSSSTDQQATREAPPTLTYQGYPQNSESMVGMQDKGEGGTTQNYQEIPVSAISRPEQWPPSQFQYNVMYLASDYTQFQQNQ